MSGDLSGKKILVVEDEYFIAADLSRELSDLGAVVVGPAGNLMSALSLIAEEQLDAAVLDVNLEGLHSYPVMEELGRKSVPYLLLTGYDEWSLPQEWRGVPRITKPCSAGAIAKLLGEIIAWPTA
ncbi:MAG: response regulator [Candidatus Andeanibacterium colombiense]|uniref:Response regulator n=1 Tax=Candidatus Andeanibacterium colombiense TaxID=3121345 RepID=A0AAJ5X871_9SPHN|nr:MAG: response regulator [Sphingomonadaceae bacterium]